MIEIVAVKGTDEKARVNWRMNGEVGLTFVEPPIVKGMCGIEKEEDVEHVSWLPDPWQRVHRKKSFIEEPVPTKEELIQMLREDRALTRPPRRSRPAPHRGPHPKERSPEEELRVMLQEHPELLKELLEEDMKNER